MESKVTSASLPISTRVAANSLRLTSTRRIEVSEIVMMSVPLLIDCAPMTI